MVCVEGHELVLSGSLIPLITVPLVVICPIKAVDAIYGIAGIMVTPGGSFIQHGAGPFRIK